jgi:hypothetical protein
LVWQEFWFYVPDLVFIHPDAGTAEEERVEGFAAMTRPEIRR